MTAQRNRLNFELTDEELELLESLKDKVKLGTYKATLMFCMRAGDYLLSNKIKKQKRDGSIVDVDVLW